MLIQMINPDLLISHGLQGSKSQWIWVGREQIIIKHLLLTRIS